MAGWHYQLNGHEFEQNLKDSEGPGEPGMLQSMGSQRVRHDLATELNWNCPGTSGYVISLAD